MKHVFYFLIFYFISAQILVGQEKLSLVLDPADLGYSADSRASVNYIEAISKDEIGVIVHISNADTIYSDPWIFNPGTKEAMRLTDYSLGRSLEFRADGEKYDYAPSYQMFKKLGDDIYYIGKETNWEEDDNQRVLYKFSSGSRALSKFELGDPYTSSIFSFMEYDDAFLIIEVNEDRGYKIYSFDGEQLTVILHTEYPEDNLMGEVAISAPFIFNDKLFGIDAQSFFSFDLKTREKTILISDLNTGEDFNNNIRTIISGYQILDNQLYVQLARVAYLKIIYLTIIESYKDEVQIWRTDGSQSGTAFLGSIPADNRNVYQNIISVLKQNGGMYWLVPNSDENNLSVYRVNESEIVHIKDIESASTYSQEEYDRYIIYGVDLFPQHFLSLNRTVKSFNFQGKDYLPVCFIYISKFDPKELFVDFSIISIEDNQVSFSLKNFSVYDENLIYDYMMGFFPDISEDRIQITFMQTDTDSFQRIKQFDIDTEENSMIELGSWDVFFGGSTVFNNRSLFILSYPASDTIFKVWEINQDVISSVSEKNTYSPIFSLYPNPGSQYLMLESEKLLKGTVSIVGMDGRIYFSKELTGFQQELDISSLSKGAYRVVYHEKGRIQGAASFIKL